MMRAPRLLLTAVACLQLLLGSPAPAKSPEWDMLITNARIVDGTGSPWYRGAVAIKDGRIAWVGTGTPDTARAARLIDAGGQALSPGFIDLMGQETTTYLVDPTAAASKLTQGITTHLSGEGGSMAPQNDFTLPQPLMVAGKPLRWKSYADYFRILETHGVPLNMVHLVGAAQVRQVVMGDADRKPTSAELAQMKALVVEAMQDGAAGLTTALIYPPGSYQSTDELVELAKAVAPFGGIYATHMRNESAQLIPAIQEALAIGKAAGIPVHIYHLKAAGVRNWPLMADALALIADARAKGQDVTTDIYPYVRNGITLTAFVPPSYFADGAKPFFAKLKSPKLRAELRRIVESDDRSWENWYDHVGRDWRNVLIVSGEAGTDLVGLNLAEAAEKRGKDPWTFLFDTIATGGVFVTPASMNEEQKHLALKAPFVFIETDSSPVSPTRDGEGAHPRGYGAFPRVLAKYVREEKVLTLEDAIHRMSLAPANRLGLYDRGRIAPGMAADLVLFDPEKVQDNATFEKPAQYSTGIDKVWVNGQLAVDGGKVTGALPGKVIRYQQ
ncbi:MAG: dihydroorotase [Sphingomonas sp.]|nr:MAG: dihydroorotase [Sphingomonas sp.]